MFLYDIMTEESFLLTIGPPIITELMYDGFTCDVSLEVISLEISWTVSIILLTLGAHAQRGLYCSWVCVSVCLCVCLLLYISPLECLFVSKTIPST